MARRLEKYEILREIGHGGMATVFEARDVVLDRAVALKVMHPHLRSAEEARQRFHREAKSVARLRHPRVLEIYDFSGVGSDEAFIAAELLTGPTLKAFRESLEEIPAEVAAALVIEIGRALEAAHAAGIIHRDVKPENVLLHEDRDLKLTDFGIADMVDAQSMTATGQILGSPGHMAPEQIEGRSCDARSDLFSLGTVLYYLSTGRLPFTGRNPHAVLTRIMNGEFTDPLRANPAIGETLRRIILRTLAVDPDDRYPDVAALRADLEAFVADIGIADSTVLVARYLSDPDGVGEEVREKAVQFLTLTGKEASAKGQIPAALDAYNRVLALDEGNEEVLRLIQRVGQSRRQRAAMVGGSALMAVGLIAAIFAWGIWSSRSDAGEEVTAGAGGGGEVQLSAAAPPSLGATDEPLAAEQEPDQGPVDVISRPARPVVSRRPRRVRFLTRPAALWLRIDGGERFQNRGGLTRQLAPGRHRFAIDVPEDSPYNDVVVERRVPPGDPAQVVDIILHAPFGAAGLLVSSPEPGTVSIDGAGQWRTGRVIELDMERERRMALVEVQIPGRDPVLQNVPLVAGTVVDMNVPIRR